MTEPKALRFVLLSVFTISTVFGVLSFLKIQYQFYLWEIFIDLKFLSLLSILFFLRSKNWYLFSLSNLHLKKVEITKNVLWFFSPIPFYTAVVCIGLMFRQIHVEGFDNATSLILATLFDVPAIYFFSATSLLIEEIFFRALLFDSLKTQKSFWISAVSCSLLWVLFSITEIINLETPTLIKSLSLAAYFMATGLLCAVLVAKYESLWISYSFRIGIISLTPLFLPSLVVEADPLFRTKLTMFSAEGFTLSLLMTIVALFLSKSIDKKIPEPTAQILQN